MKIKTVNPVSQEEYAVSAILFQFVKTYVLGRTEILSFQQL